MLSAQRFWETIRAREKAKSTAVPTLPDSVKKALDLIEKGLLQTKPVVTPAGNRLVTVRIPFTRLSWLSETDLYQLHSLCENNGYNFTARDKDGKTIFALDPERVVEIEIHTLER